ncbi:Hypothetical predicted protein [Xyrichtys novacula]|uniref:Uncharacterized protein n=1 Tax=Xyrichtys novacula TaxID=13765 RepID=A0AAV1HRN1_XYRNO|nr:Hypothetical predicted protein [Xyrichtys novacula]
MTTPPPSPTYPAGFGFDTPPHAAKGSNGDFEEFTFEDLLKLDLQSPLDSPHTVFKTLCDNMLFEANHLTTQSQTTDPLPSLSPLPSSPTHPAGFGVNTPLIHAAESFDEEALEFTSEEVLELFGLESPLDSPRTVFKTLARCCDLLTDDMLYEADHRTTQIQYTDPLPSFSPPSPTYPAGLGFNTTPHPANSGAGQFAEPLAVLPAAQTPFPASVNPQSLLPQVFQIIPVSSLPQTPYKPF